MGRREKSAGSQRNKHSIFPNSGLLHNSFCFVYPHDYDMMTGAPLVLIESICGSFDTKIMGIFMPTYNDSFYRSAFYSHGSFPVFLSVAHPQDPHHPSEKPVIHCHKCGEPCKGEVLRVQTKHFHIKCFTCKGKAPLASWQCGMSRSKLVLEAAPSP